MSAPLNEFIAVLNSSGPAWLGGPEEIVQETQKQSYTLPHLTAGKIAEIMFQGGDEAKGMVNLELTSTFTRYNPNPTINYIQAQPGQVLTVPWAFAYAYISHAKQDIGLNKEMTTKKARAQKYKSVMWLKRQNYQVDVANSMEEEFWATPDYATMEAATPTGVRKPYSIPVFVNEWTNGLPLGFEAATGGANTVEQISSVTFTKWRNHAVTYANVDTATANLFHGFKRMRQAVQFDKIPREGAKYGETETKPEVIFTSSWGDRLYEQCMVAGNQNFYGGGASRPGQDPAYDVLQYHRVPIVRITQLDSALLYPNAGASAYASEATADLTGPRFYFINGRYFFPFFHSDNYGQLGNAMIPANQPFSVVQVMDLWNNLGCQSRYRSGILSPAADTTLAA